MSFSESVNDLFTSQLAEWELAKNNYSQLGNVKTRTISYGNFSLVVQFNPGRITSSAAKVDAKSIQERPCFLCEKNRPPEQRGLVFENDYTLLVNPFPIFRKHLTIVSDSHTDQRIKDNFGVMLRLAFAIPDYVVFYNGPQCGASAPDHLHFQAGNRGFLPLEDDFIRGKAMKIHTSHDGCELWQWNDYGRGIITLRSKDHNAMVRPFAGIYGAFAELQSERPEPMLNILAYVSEGFCTAHIIPRKQHRPSQFFEEGDTRILLSPASVDMGGVVITPREEDFNKITGSDISDILRQVCYSDNEILTVTRKII